MKEDSTFPDNPIKIGKNAIENDQLIKQAKQTDLWFHLANLASTHVILSVDKDHPATSEMIQYCAILTKSNTKFRNVPKTKVIYTEIKNVKRLEEPGKVHIVGKKRAKTVMVDTHRNGDEVTYSAKLD